MYIHIYIYVYTYISISPLKELYTSLKRVLRESGISQPGGAFQSAAPRAGRGATPGDGKQDAASGPKRELGV